GQLRSRRPQARRSGARGERRRSTSDLGLGPPRQPRRRQAALAVALVDFVVFAAFFLAVKPATGAIASSTAVTTAALASISCLAKRAWDSTTSIGVGTPAG